MVSSQFDFIVVGGGTAGCVVASRLHQRRPNLSILVLEAGPDITDHPHISKPLESALLHGSEIDWNYQTVKQRHLNNETRYNCAVKALSGGVAINSGGWIRGDALDYDEWARQVGDKRWGYDGMLPYFKRSEHHFDPNADPTQHGFNGPMYTCTALDMTLGKPYPLREVSRAAFSRLGYGFNPDANNGSPQGIAEQTFNRRDGLRQLTSNVYPLDGVQVMTNTLVSHIILNEHKQAQGVELADGQRFHVKQGGEVILSAGAYRTPQILMLSGIGDGTYLESKGIQPHVNLPDVGQNLHDHLMALRYWKLRHPEKGLALGSPVLTDPAYLRGLPVDWIVTSPIEDIRGLKAALEKDEGVPIKDDHPLVKGTRSHLEFLMLYATFGGEQIGLDLPPDGSAIVTYCMGCLPTSRGSITLQSKDPARAPVIDPNYYATETDKFVMREGWRKMSQLVFETPEGKELVESEIVPEGHRALASNAADEEIDSRIKIGGMTVYHPAASASMGKVVDPSLKVYGVEGIRVVDASVIPIPLASHYQVAVFAIAEQAVDILLGEVLES